MLSIRFSIRRVPRILLGLAVCWAPLVTATTITDGFEGPTLGPLWTQDPAGPGIAAPTNSTYHTGSQSLLEQLVPTAPFYASVRHDFGSLGFGFVSVYSKIDPDTGEHTAMGIGTPAGALALFEYTTSANQYMLRVFHPGVPEEDTFFDGNPFDWHLLEIVSDAAGLTFKFDGTTKLTDPTVAQFQWVSLDTWGNSSGHAYFDDFSATQYTPEPSTCCLAGGALAILLCWRRRRS